MTEISMKDCLESIELVPGSTIKIPTPNTIGWLVHEPTHTRIAVFKRINWWQAWWLNFCFGLKYEKI